MAKQQQTKGRDAHIRLIVLEATLPDGDVSQLAQAIQNALRPTLASPSKTVISASTPQAPQLEGTVVDVEDEAQETATEEGAAPRRAPREPRVRRVSTPQAVELAANEVTSWQEFIADKEADKEVDRYLCVAAWSQEHHNDEPVTAGLVYACYRLAKWSVAIDDFGKHLRAAKSQQYLRQVSRGEYRITQLGLQKVDELSKD